MSITQCPSRSITRLLSAAAGLCMIAAAPLASAQIAGSGSSVAAPLIAALGKQFAGQTPAVTYESTGSGAGIKALQEGSADFAVSELPMSFPELERGGFVQVPISADALVLAVNLPGATRVALRGEQIADLYRGRYASWADIAVAAGQAKLPAVPVSAVVRADASGSTYLATTYLTRSDKFWRGGPGAGLTVKWPGSPVQAKGGKEMIEKIKATAGAFGYTDLAAAVKAGLLVVELQNAAGAYVKPAAQSIAGMLESAPWTSRTGTADVDGTGGASAWPITAVSYLIYKRNGPRAKQIQAFANKAVDEGDQAVVQSGLIPIPAAGKRIAKVQISG